MKLKVGDLVQVNIGRDRGKKGKIQKVLSKKDRVMVEGINIYKKHIKKQAGGGIIEKIFSLDASKVSLVCPKCNQPTRIGYILNPNKSKVRVCRKCKLALNQE